MITRRLLERVKGETVRAEWRNKDRYGRPPATLHPGDTNINTSMVRNGYAWRYRYARKTGVIAIAEKHAKKHGPGMWKASPLTPPWVREGKRTAPDSREPRPLVPPHSSRAPENPPGPVLTSPKPPQRTGP